MAFILASVMVSCTTAPTTETTEAPQPSPTSTHPDLSDELNEALGRIKGLADQVTALSRELEASERERIEAESALAEARAEVGALLLAYDPQIQERLTAGASEVVAATCSAIDGPLAENQLTRLIDRQIADWAEQPGLPEGAEDALDRAAIESEISACHAQVVEEAHKAVLRAPKGDGFWTVGEEIAPGTWESQGTGDDCYWARLDANQEILDNHFGNAGGRITIRASDAEVEFADCGTWEFRG